MEARTDPGPTRAVGWHADPDRDGRLRWWDGASWTPETVYAAQHARLGRSVPWWSAALVVLLLAQAVVGVAATVVDRDGIAILTGLVEFDAPTRIAYDAYDGAARALTAWTWGLLVVTAGVWCAWQYRLAGLVPPSRLHDTPEMHVGAWFVPVVNLVRPARNVHDLARGLAVPPGRTPVAATVLGLVWWLAWLTWLVSLPLLFVLWVRVFSAPTMLDYLGQAAVGQLLGSVAAVLAAAVVLVLALQARAHVRTVHAAPVA